MKKQQKRTYMAISAMQRYEKMLEKKVCATIKLKDAEREQVFFACLLERHGSRPPMNKWSV